MPPQLECAHQHPAEGRLLILVFGKWLWTPAECRLLVIRASSGFLPLSKCSFHLVTAFRQPC